jgi:hypothetical protein
MADEIKINSTFADGKTVQNSGSQSGTAGSAGSSTTGTSAQTTNQTVSAVPVIPATESMPVIDLRKMDFTQPDQASAPAQIPANTVPAAPQPPMPPKSSNSTGLNLEDAAMSASNQSVAPPPEKFAVPDMVKQKFPDLIQLIKDTESMNDEERDYWFQILPIMTEEQISKFRDILLNEKNQLSKLDKEYEGELTKLNEKHMIEWKEFETKEKRKALTQAEQASNNQEQSTEEDLLKRLSSV